jgi:hypothetical protein
MNAPDEGWKILVRLFPPPSEITDRCPAAPSA